MVVVNDGLHGTIRKTGTVRLAAGKHQVNLLYFNNSRGPSLTATVRAANGKTCDLAFACSPSEKKQNMAALKEAMRKKQALEEQQALIKVSSPAALVPSSSAIFTNS